MKASGQKPTQQKIKTQHSTPGPFNVIVSAMTTIRGVTQTKMFGSAGLKFKGKVFAMEVNGHLVVKLPKERVDAMVAAGKAEYFDPGHGRLMKEWATIPLVSVRTWITIAKEAKEYIGSLV